jgi:glycosyltransferase 2 family protein
MGVIHWSGKPRKPSGEHSGAPTKNTAPIGNTASGPTANTATTATENPDVLGAPRQQPPEQPGRPGPRGRGDPSSWGAQRVRRPADLLAAILALAVAAVIIGSIKALPAGSTEVAGDVSRWLRHIPRWLAFGAAVIAGTACFVFVIVALVQLTRSQWRDARNAAVGLGVGAAAAIAATAVWDAEHGRLQAAALHGKYPAMFVIDTAFVAFVVASDLTRRSHWSRWCTGLVAALLITTVAQDTLTPFAMVIALSGGLGAGLLVRWALGAASVRPSAAELVPWLRSRGVDIVDLVPGYQPGNGPSDPTGNGPSSRPGNGPSDSPSGRPSAQSRRAHLKGSLADGTPVEVQLADRDTRGSGLARGLWAAVRLRPGAAGHIALSSRVQLERLALASALAQRAGVLSPAVLLLDETPRESLVLVLATPPGHPLDGAVSKQQARALFGSLRALHDASIAHRDLRPESLCLAEPPESSAVPDCLTAASAGFRSLDSAMPAAGELARRLDIAQLLAIVGRFSGTAEAVGALRDGYGPADEAAIAAVLQPVALAPWGWQAMRKNQACLTEIRHEMLGQDTAAPQARLERFRWRTVLSAVALIAAAYVLIGQFSKVNLLGTLTSANPGWFAVAVLGSAVTYFAAAQNLAAFVPKRLHPLRGSLVQLSTAFVGVAMPPTVGHVAVNARYLHKEGVDEGAIGVAVALSQLVNVIATVLLLVVVGLLTGSGLSQFKIAPGANVLIGLAVIAGVIAVLLSVPKTRAKLIGLVWPHLRRAWPRLLDAVSQPTRLAVSAGANLLLTLAYLVAFIAALRSVGAHPAILPAAVVYLAGNAVGTAAPTPGGLGGVEAVLAAGLTAMGVPAAQAISGVLVFRIATFWLPIAGGWVSYLWLQRRRVL